MDETISLDSMKMEIERMLVQAKDFEEKARELREKVSEMNGEQPKKKVEKKLKLVKFPKGTEEVKDSQIPMGMKNWRILGELNAKATKAMQLHIEASSVMKKRAVKMEIQRQKREAARAAAIANGTARKMNPMLDPKRTRFDTGQVYSDMRVMVGKGLFPLLTTQTSLAAIEWGKDMRNSWGHFNFVKLLRHPKNYLAAMMVIFGPTMIDNEGIYKECQFRLNQSGWKQRKVLPPKVPEN